MQTPDEFRYNCKQTKDLCQEDSPSAPQYHKCKNCGRHFDHRTSGGNVFHDDKCKSKLDSNLRSAYRYVRSNLNPLPNMEFCAVSDLSPTTLTSRWQEILPNAETPRYDAILREINELDNLMETVGPIDAGVRRIVKTRATVLATVLRSAGFRYPLDQRLFIHTLELLCAVGIEMPFTTQKIQELLGYAVAVVDFFVGQDKDLASMLNLSRALMAWGNVLRILGSERAANRRFTWAYNVMAEGPFRIAPTNQVVGWYRHQAISWLLRTRGRFIAVEKRKEEVAEMARLALDVVRDPRLLVQHFRDMAGHAIDLFGDFRKANEYLLHMYRARKELSSRYLDVTLLRPRIELLFETHQVEEAIELVRTGYVQLYSHHRDAYYYNLLQEWSRDRKFEFAAPLRTPEYVSPILAFLPRRLASPLV
jgi:hypothetical protein